MVQGKQLLNSKKRRVRVKDYFYDEKSGEL